MEPSDNEQAPDDAGDRKVSNDEELTPLNWLHDKNLLKGDWRSSEAAHSQINLRLLIPGINLSCPKVQSPSELRNGTASADDSGVSEDNSVVNSSSENVSVNETVLHSRRFYFFFEMKRVEKRLKRKKGQRVKIELNFSSGVDS